VIVLWFALVAHANGVSDGADKYEQGDLDGALSAWQATEASGPASGALLYDLGDAWYRKGDVPLAIAYWRAAREVRPRDADVEAIVAQFAGRGRECAFANVRLLGRVITSYYDAALKPAGLRASQLALLWAIVACAPVEMGRLGELTQTDQTTLSRTVEKLRQAGLVAVEAGEDRRVRMLRLTDDGRTRFARAMPYWEAAQREMDRWFSVESLKQLAKRAHRLASDANQ
jgi:DNA-binding MarR family transcriptional regulator